MLTIDNISLVENKTFGKWQVQYVEEKSQSFIKDVPHGVDEYYVIAVKPIDTSGRRSTAIIIDRNQNADGKYGIYIVWGNFSHVIYNEELDISDLTETRIFFIAEKAMEYYYKELTNK